MELDLQHFLPIYPEFNKEVSNILGEEYNRTKPNYDIYRKKEFYDYKLKKIESVKNPTIPEYMNHQMIIARFLSSRTIYSGILLMHEPGTGKTCSSVAAIEQIRSETNSFKGALIMTKGPAQRDNYLNELVNQCTCYEKLDGKCIAGRYIDSSGDQEDLDLLSAKEKKLFLKREQRKIKNSVSDFYQFETFEMFISELSKLSSFEIRRNYSNRVIVIDEAHNLRLTNEKSQYNKIHQFLHTIVNCKVILLTGTPMRDSPTEIASMMNLILPLDQQFPIEESFEEEFLIKSNDSMIVRPDKKQLLKSRLHGHVSYLKAMRADVVPEFQGTNILTHFKLYPKMMKLEQLDVYRKAWKRDNEQEEQGVYSNSRQASLFVFPNGSYGNEKDGFKRYIVQKRIKNDKKVVRVETVFNNDINDSIQNIIKKHLPLQEKLEILKKYSIKYADCIKTLIENRSNHFVYISFVTGSGAILFSKLLELFGFQQSKGQDTQPALRYSVITNLTTTPNEMKNIFKEFNSRKNIDGDYIRVIVGSKMISESITLKNVQHIHILTPSWNFGETDQAIARAIRLGSHRDLEEALVVKNGLTSISQLKSKGITVKVKIYLYCAQTDSLTQSIDYYMYKTCEDKDISIKSVEQCLKEASFDCALNKERNEYILKDGDGSRDCNYTDCNYSCDGITSEEYVEPEIDLSTYHLFYDQNDITRLIVDIKQIFSKVTKMSYEALIDRLEYRYDEFSIIKAIDAMISNNDIITDQFGNHCFLRCDHNIVYLTYLLGETTFLDQYYVDHFPLQEKQSFDEMVEDTYSEYLPSLFDKMKNASNDDERRKLMEKIPLEGQEIMIELAVLSRKQDIKDVDPIREFIIKYFESYLLQLNSETVASTLLYDEDDEEKEKLRCLTEKWEDCDETKTEMIKKKLSDKKEEAIHNPYGYYGMIEKDKMDKDNPLHMSIRDVSDEAKIKDTLEDGAKNRHKKTRGKACGSWHKDDFLKLLYTFKIVPGPDSIKDYRLYTNYQEYSKQFSGFTTDQYMELLNRDGFKEVRKAFGETFRDFSVEDKNRMLYWGKQGDEGEKLDKNVICTTLKKFFIEKKILF